VWVGADLTTRGFHWVLLAGAFVTLITGLIDSQVGFGKLGKQRAGRHDRHGRADGSRPQRSPATDEPRPVRTERKRLS
jgi:hypothetical protein